MSGTVVELLDLVARWVHVIAGIMWVGNSLLFNWLDRNLRPSDGPKGDASLGQIWLLHSGAFYFVDKNLLGGRGLPSPLHWFKWQAYTTWLSGAALLVVVYYAGARAALGDASVAALTHREAVMVSVGAIVGGWALYESMQRFVAPRSPVAALVVWVAGLIAIAIALTQLLSGRAAFLHVGAILGTIMAANVFFTIVPSQRELVASIAEGSGASSAVSARAKRVSIHNNYFSFPVIVLMVSSHFSAAYGGRWNWAVLLVLIAAGALVRHVLNTRNTTPSWKGRLAMTVVASALGSKLLLDAGQAVPPAAVATGPVAFADVRRIIDRRCAACHSLTPSDVSFGVAPAGVNFDTPEQIIALAQRIRERAVVTRTMPPANKTHMTEDERALLGRWSER